MSKYIKSIEDINLITRAFYKHTDDSVIKYINRNKINISCKSGCDMCCKTIRVEILSAEVFYIVDRIKNLFSKNEIDIFLQEMKINDEKLNGKTLIEQKDTEIKCPFLIDSKCSIYEFRPYKCRTYYGLSKNFCIADRCWTPQLNEINSDNDLKKTLNKYIKTLDTNNLDYTPAELNNALYKALVNDSIIIKYLKKEKKLFSELKHF
ncbi:YkgJ family cysteine cluster protein [Halarcobacter sp.]|uniref:YkgJ family cysteine cluster protein n=1 Tax=Halarcobacter sp. TaxID=2321133 RepID=UPI002AABF3C8|nr:YkgJ family cysteine cluster protein [Halarcobacter sp.]